VGGTVQTLSDAVACGCREHVCSEYILLLSSTRNPLPTAVCKVVTRFHGGLPGVFFCEQLHLLLTEGCRRGAALHPSMPCCSAVMHPCSCTRGSLLCFPALPACREGSSTVLWGRGESKELWCWHQVLPLACSGWIVPFASGVGGKNTFLFFNFFGVTFFLVPSGGFPGLWRPREWLRAQRSKGNAPPPLYRAPVGGQAQR